jgi:thiosulfate/3-mercaptopyruvate sulfurtransferase
MNPLITPTELAARLIDPKTVVFDATLTPPGVPADPHASYLAQHIPGALFFDIEALSDHATTLPHMLPAADTFAAAMSALGVADTASIVVYEQNGVFSAPRAWWMLRTFGAENVSVLDGGLSAWVAAGLPTESGPVLRRHPRAEGEGPPHSAAAPATFHAALTPHAVVGFAQLQHLLTTHAQILDARSAGRFHGTAPEPRPGLPSGHMPGATSLPFATLVDSGRLKPAGELRDLFAAAGLDLDQPITTTCGSGVTAAVLTLGLTLAGAQHLSLYDGSWAEYAQHPEATIVTG